MDFASQARLAVAATLVLCLVLVVLVYGLGVSLGYSLATKVHGGTTAGLQ